MGQVILLLCVDFRRHLRTFLVFTSESCFDVWFHSVALAYDIIHGKQDLLLEQKAVKDGSKKRICTDREEEKSSKCQRTSNESTVYDDVKNKTVFHSQLMPLDLKVRVLFSGINSK